MSFARGAVLAVLAVGAGAAHFAGGPISLRALLMLLGMLALALTAHLAMHLAWRAGKGGSWLLYARSGLDVSLVSGVLAAGLFWAPESHDLLSLAYVAYFAVIIISARRFHPAATAFSAGLGAVQYAALMLGAHFAESPGLATSQVAAHLMTPASVAVRTIFILIAGALAVANVLRVRRALSAHQAIETVHGRVVHQMSDGVLICNADQRIVEVNPTACSLLGLSRKVQVEASVILPAPLSTVLRSRWAEVLSQGFVFVHGVRVMAADATERRVDLAVHLVRQGAERLVQIVLRDVTAEHQLREQAQHFERLRSLRSVVANIAHEFNNTFASIQASSYVLSDRLEPHNPLHQEVATIRSGAGRAAGLLRDVIDIIDVRRPELEPVNVRTLITRALAAGQPQSAVRLQLDIADDVGCVWGDEAQLLRGLTHMILWAYNAMLDGGTLTITASVESVARGDERVQAGQYVRLEVMDTGIGLPADLAAQAFDPVQGGGELRLGGLGLAGVRAIVTRHGGTIDFTSSMGRGSSFVVRLSAADQAPPASLPASEVPARSGEKVRLLVVDDEPANRTSLARVLRIRGYEVFLAEDGLRALEICDNEGPVDLVLLDLLMPGISGKDVLQSLRLKHVETKVLVVSGQTDTSWAKEALNLGAAGVVTKPFDVDELLRKIARLTQRAPESPRAQGGALN